MLFDSCDRLQSQKNMSPAATQVLRTSETMPGIFRDNSVPCLTFNFIDGPKLICPQPAEPPCNQCLSSRSLSLTLTGLKRTRTDSDAKLFAATSSNFRRQVPCRNVRLGWAIPHEKHCRPRIRYAKGTVPGSAILHIVEHQEHSRHRKSIGDGAKNRQRNDHGSASSRPR